MKNHIIKSLNETYRRKNLILSLILLGAILLAFFFLFVGFSYVQKGLSLDNDMALRASNSFLIMGGLSEFFAVLVIIFSLNKGKDLIKTYNDLELKLKYGNELIEESNPKAQEFINLMLLNNFFDTDIQPEFYIKLLNNDKPKTDSLLKELLDSEEKTTLRIYVTRGIHLDDLQKMLKGINLIYQSFYFLYYPSKIPFRFNDKESRSDFEDFLYRRDKFKRNSLSEYYPLSYGHEEMNLISMDDALFISKISISSPGFWEFLGKMMPLLQLREYLKERHERQKDRQYKNEIEKERFMIENSKNKKLAEIELKEREYEYYKQINIESINSELEKNKVIRERIEILKSLGFKEEELRTFITNPLKEGMSIIDFFKMNGIIDEQKSNFNGDNLTKPPPLLNEGEK